MARFQRLSLLAWLTAPALLAAGAACTSATANQAITEVVPAAAAPGSVVLLLGRGFAPGGAVRLDDRPLDRLTWVNAELAAAVLPSDVAPGVHPLQVRFPDAREAVVYLTVAAPAASPSVQASPPSPPAAQPPTVAPAAPAPRPVAPAPPAKRDEHDDKGKGRGKGR